MRQRARWLALTVILGLTGCGDGAGAADAGRMDGGEADAAAGDAARPCERLSDCDDEVFCNGEEACVDAVCVRGAPPCAAAEVCVEAESECVRPGCEGTLADRDGDMVRSAACGGSDCDDDDGDRFPGHAEVCDAEGHDEDCDPRTYGFRDADADGYVSTTCCNGATCGPDCDDGNAAVSPGATEACDGLDNDCDGSIDEALPLMRCYRDEDGDGYGVTGDSEMRCACGSGWAVMPGDCADRVAEAHPGATWRAGGYCNAPPGVECVIGTRSGDWNCDGAEERRYPVTCADALGCSPIPDCSDCGGCWDGDRVPGCDEPGATWRQWNPDCTQTTSLRRQECR